MKKYILYILGTISFLLLSCEKLFIENAEDTPEQILESLWKSYDLHYPCFAYKKINWDSIHTVYNKWVYDDMTSDQLFMLFTIMLDNLKDGHVWIMTDKKFYTSSNSKQCKYYYQWDIVNSYLLSVQTRSVFTYGKLEGNIGYFNISTFESKFSGYGYIDNILNEFSECKGIIIDVRNNSGGSVNNANMIASRFCDKKRAYCNYQFRNGPNHNDFSGKEYYFFEPSKNAKPDIPIVLITDNSVGSASEDFVLMMRILPQTTVIGDYTRGNPGGRPVIRELQNGWLYYMPTALQYTMDDEIYIDDGIKPDILVRETETGKDLMIEKAIEILK